MTQGLRANLLCSTHMLATLPDRSTRKGGKGLYVRVACERHALNHAGLCQPHTGINKFFSVTLLKRWNNIENFTKSAYNNDPTLTAQQVLDQYIQSLNEIINIKEVGPNVKRHVQAIRRKIIKTEYLKIIGDTLLEVIRNDAKQRKGKTSQTRKDFQSAMMNDIENRKSAGYINSYKLKLNDEIDKFWMSPGEQQPNRFTKKLRNLDDNDETIECKSTWSDEDNDLNKNSDDEKSVEMGKSNIAEFRDSYKAMKKEKKWYLTSGKCVEDELYFFGNRCRFEQYIFNSEELKEIRDTGAKNLPEMPSELLKYISSFRMKTTKDLRVELCVRQDWEGENFDKIKHFNFDWVKNSIYNLILEYESDTLQQKHLEAWHNIHIWSFIDKCFNELEGVDIARGESCSLASSKRKNNRRIVQGIVKTTRKSIGRRGDLIIRKGSYEYGASEVGKDYDGDNGSKLLKERGLKSPKMLKDMIVNLGNFVEWKAEKLRQFELVSFIHAGLFMILLRMDVPAGYICRITRSDTLQMPTNVNQFEKALKCLVLTWKAKMIVRKTIEVVEEMCDGDTLEDLQEAGARKQRDLTILSNCIMTPQKKRKANMINA
ncbi:14391_t:CDS:2 [Cetraspora pellucida]|uniref:14391_t:CDS:1 n=1 Tax=Cetraspora pellucida TaxID=1433469 RepID=A0A9N8ZPJ9_9GLOM|nr:14391_t:CDS:2 [Cetraspora pellucida]